MLHEFAISDCIDCLHALAKASALSPALLRDAIPSILANIHTCDASDLARVSIVSMVSRVSIVSMVSIDTRAVSDLARVSIEYL